MTLILFGTYQCIFFRAPCIYHIPLPSSTLRRDSVYLPCHLTVTTLISVNAQGSGSSFPSVDISVTSFGLGGRSLLFFSLVKFSMLIRRYSKLCGQRVYTCSRPCRYDDRACLRDTLYLILIKMEHAMLPSANHRRRSRWRLVKANAIIHVHLYGLSVTLTDFHPF